MVVHIKVILILAVLSSVGNCSVQFTHNGKNGMVKEGTSISIACYFNGEKPPGPSRWTLSGQVVAIDCIVQPPGIGVITPSTDCSPDTGNGMANYAFVINKVSLDRDKDKWVCQNIGLDERLNIPIAVIGAPGGYKINRENKEKAYFTVTARLGCSYPPATVHWCLSNGNDIICSDNVNWTAGVFEENPVIFQKSEECTGYKTPGVFKYLLRIESNVIGSVDGDIYQLFYCINGINYDKNVLWLEDLSQAEDSSSNIPFTHEIDLHKSTFIVHITAVVYLMVSIILIVACGFSPTLLQKSPISQKHLQIAFSFGKFLGYGLFLSSFVLYIVTNTTNQELSVVDSILISFVGILTIIYSVLLYWFQKRERKFKKTTKSSGHDPNDSLLNGNGIKQEEEHGTKEKSDISEHAEERQNGEIYQDNVRKRKGEINHINEGLKKELMYSKKSGYGTVVIHTNGSDLNHRVTV